MNDEQTHRSNDWLVPPNAGESVGESVGPTDAPPPADRRRGLLRAAGLVVGGLVIGGATVATVQAVADDDAGTRTAAGWQGNGAPQGMPGGGFAGGPGGAPAGGPGAVAGEQHLEGTLTAVTSTTVTVKTSDGTDTYELTDSTQIVRNGQAATADDLEVGDPVLVHVYPSGSGDQLAVERIFAGTMPGFDDAPGSGTAPGASTT